MSLMPYIAENMQSTTNVDAFGGYNHNLSIGEAEFYDMKNMVVEKYPFASNRPPRGKLTFGDRDDVVGVCGKDTVYVAFTDEKEITVTTSEPLQEAQPPANKVFGDEKYTQIPIDPAFDGATKLMENTTSLTVNGDDIKRFADRYDAENIYVKQPHNARDFVGDIYCSVGRVDWKGNACPNKKGATDKLYIKANKSTDATAKLIEGKNIMVNGQAAKVLLSKLENNVIYNKEVMNVTSSAAIKNEIANMSHVTSVKFAPAFEDKAVGTKIYQLLNNQITTLKGGWTDEAEDWLDEIYNYSEGQGMTRIANAYWRNNYNTIEFEWPHGDIAYKKAIYLPLLMTSDKDPGYFDTNKNNARIQLAGLVKGLTEDDVKKMEKAKFDLDRILGCSYIKIAKNNFATLPETHAGFDGYSRVADLFRNLPIVYSRYRERTDRETGNLLKRHELAHDTINIVGIFGDYLIYSGSFSRGDQGDNIVTQSPNCHRLYLKIGEIDNNAEAMSESIMYDKLAKDKESYTYRRDTYISLELDRKINVDEFDSDVSIMIGSVDKQIDAVRESDYYTMLPVTSEEEVNDKAFSGRDVTFRYSLNGEDKEQTLHVDFTEALYDSKGKYTGVALAVRKPFTYIPTGAVIDSRYKDKLFIAEYDVKTETISHKTALCDAVDGKKTVLDMGAYIVIFPEKVMVNTLVKSDDEDYVYTEIKRLDKEELIYDWEYEMVDHNGDLIIVKTYGSKTPTNPEANDYWLDNSESVPVLYKYSELQQSWATVQPYCKFYGVEEAWNEGDAVIIEINDDNLVPVEGQKYFVIYKAGVENGRNYIEFPVAFRNSHSNSGTDIISIRKGVPDMDYVIECNNRIWGCKYGLNEFGETINEIFASKLGDPTNWNYFQNTSVDSYYVSLGSDGMFTGAVSYESNPVFFRDNCVHRIYGNYPANYQLKTVIGAGVADGSNDTVVVMNGICYYLARDGVYAYSGGIPIKISDAFGFEKYHGGAAGTTGHTMYMTIYDKDDRPVSFKFNDNYKMWHKQDDIDIKHYFEFDGDMYGVTSGSEMLALEGNKGRPEDNVEWMLQTGNIGYALPFRKYINKMIIRIMLALNAVCSIEIQYDSDGNWTRVAEVRPTGKIGAVAVPIVPRRCDHFAIRLVGKNDVQLAGITKFYEEGSCYD